MDKPFFAYRSFKKALETKKQFSEIGVNQYVIFSSNTTNTMGSPYSEYDESWNFYSMYNTDPIDEEFGDLFSIHPDAEVLFMVDLNTPLWLARRLRGDSFTELCRMEAEPEWVDLTTEYVKNTVSYVNEKYGDRIIAFILMGGSTDEWINHDFGVETRNKFAAYQNWYRRMGYGEIDSIPRISERFQGTVDGGAIRNPITEQETIRYWKFHSDLNVDTILNFADAVRPMLKKGQDLGCFFGYIFESSFRQLVSGAHLSYERLEESKKFDFIICPGEYEDRALGGGSGFMSPYGTAKKNGLNVLLEIDHRTHTANLDIKPHVSINDIVKTHVSMNTDEDIVILRRDFSKALIHGASLWWFDMFGGFYDDPEVRKAIEAMGEIHKSCADLNRQPNAEIALAADPDNALLIYDYQPEGKYAKIYRKSMNLCNRLGAPYIGCSFRDIESLSEDIKVLILPAMIQITKEKQQVIERAVSRGITVIFLGPTGLFTEEAWRNGLPGTVIGVEQEEMSPWLLKEIDPQPVRKICKKAGVHCYIDEPVPVSSDRDLLSIHLASGGTKEVHLRERARKVTELFTGKVVAENQADFLYEFRTPDTVLFHMEYE